MHLNLVQTQRKQKENNVKEKAVENSCQSENGDNSSERGTKSQNTSGFSSLSAARTNASSSPSSPSPPSPPSSLSSFLSSTSTFSLSSHQHIIEGLLCECFSLCVDSCISLDITHFAPHLHFKLFSSTFSSQTPTSDLLGYFTTSLAQDDSSMITSNAPSSEAPVLNEANAVSELLDAAQTEENNETIADVSITSIPPSIPAPLLPSVDDDRNSKELKNEERTEEINTKLISSSSSSAVEKEKEKEGERKEEEDDNDDDESSDDSSCPPLPLPPPPPPPQLDPFEDDLLMFEDDEDDKDEYVDYDTEQNNTA